jgi:hypothetical protein
MAVLFVRPIAYAQEANYVYLIAAERLFGGGIESRITDSDPLESIANTQIRQVLSLPSKFHIAQDAKGSLFPQKR